MRMSKAGVAATMAAMLAAGHAVAQTDQTLSSHAPAEGSVYVRCDGFPPHRSAGELAARILLIMATAGLAGPGEKADVNKRLSGADGVAACTAALAGETDEIRKVQLTLARAVHYIEAKDYQSALSDAQVAPTLAGAKTNDFGFQHSLMLSSLELQAYALVYLNRPAEAEATALTMAEIAPYDVIAQERAGRFVGLTADLTPAKKAYFERAAKITPSGALYYAHAYEWIGDYTTAAGLYQAVLERIDGFKNDKTPPVPQPALEAGHAIALAMAGHLAESNAIAAATRKEIDALMQNGQSAPWQSVVNSAEEELDFQAIAADFAAGKVAQARAAFAARSRWTATPAAAVADLTERLRKGAPADALTGALARDPASIRSDSHSAWAGALTSEADNQKNLLYSAIRPLTSMDQYNHWNDDIRQTTDSPFLPKKNGKETYTGDFVFMPRANGIPTGEALLMHCALLARAQGKAGFMLNSYRPRLDAAIVRFGNPGDPGMPASLFIDAATVIAALSGEFPDPAVKTAKH
ncbi:MAG TPA: hypothetical protein VMD53_04840 [Rhizomicrobium sp.]|nr:hypothetical protein [Rhizomicrobium sp.]